jgi:hypothetical protein
MTTVNHKEVALIFRGFECSPERVEELLSVRASEKGVRGSPVKPAVKTILKRSFARFPVTLDPTVRLDQVISILLDELGGMDKLIVVRDSVAPEFFEIGILWPVKNSEEQEGGFFSPSVISGLAGLRCSLSFSFV